MKQGYKIIIITIVCFAIYLLLKTQFSPIMMGINGWIKTGLLSYILTYAIIGIPIYIGAYLIKPQINVLANLGLNLDVFRPLIFTIICTLPMLLGGLIFFDFNNDISIPNLIAGTIVVGFVEELFYRGFLFGQLFKYTNLGFIISILFGAILFGSVHLYQSQEIIELVGIFMVTFMGAIFFAWLYVEWNYNLWVPIFLHAFMNLAWKLFDMDDTALGGALPNIFRGLTIALAIVATILYKRKNNKKLVITRDNLLPKKR